MVDYSKLTVEDGPLSTSSGDLPPEVTQKIEEYVGKKKALRLPGFETEANAKKTFMSKVRKYANGKDWGVRGVVRKAEGDDTWTARFEVSEKKGNRPGAKQKEATPAKKAAPGK